jgi:exosome complex component CSL4
MSTAEGSFVVPGDALGAGAGECVAGDGAYVLDGTIRASLAGTLIADKDFSGSRRLNVVTNFEKAEDLVLNVGDKVLCRVQRTNYSQAFVDILALEDRVLPTPGKGVIRREDISSTDVDKVVVQERLKGGDVVRAAIISLGDNRHYYLSTAEEGLGVARRKAP